MNRPWMPLYVGQYLADTAHLSAAESGAYLHLIMHYWMNDGLPSDNHLLARIAKMTPTQWKGARPIIEPFFQEGWKHKRIEFELTEASRISAAGKAGGKASGAARRATKDQRSTNDQRTTDERSFNDQATIGEALPLPSQRKEDSPADAGLASVPTYAFESGVIRLTQKDFDKWKQSFSHIDVPAELIGMTEWAGTQARWFHAVSGLLAKRNREMQLRIEQRKGEPEFKWKSGIEGVM